MSARKNTKKKEDVEVKEERKKREMEKRRVAQFLHGGLQPSCGRDNKTRAKLAAKLAHRKKTESFIPKEDHEKEALRIQLLQEARQAQIEMEERRAERIILEERLRVFQERLEEELAQAAEYAALKFLEEHERREREEMFRRVEEIQKREMEEQKMKEMKEQVEEVEEISEPPVTDYKEAVYARLLEYEVARFEILEILRKRHLDKMEKQLEEIRNAEESVQEDLTNLEKENEKELKEVELPSKEEEPETFDDQENKKREAENVLKEKVLRKLKSKLQKRILVRKQKDQEAEELDKGSNRHRDDDDERNSWEREDRMEQVQYMRRGFRGGF
uniref:Meiosis-specific nuclear structural protein 1 n=1 Tax=Caenorhabditis tropicalis TaxID=1561998 RepID=A0A1I7TYE6_9PELO